MLAMALVLTACGSDAADTASGQRGATIAAADAAAAGIARYRVEVVSTVAHNTDAFTQGFLFDADGRLWEGTGLVGESELRRLDPDTGEVVASTALPATVFGEGVASGPNGLVQLTWQQRTAYRWTPDGEPIGTFTYDGEGWGLTFDGTDFIQSDGSSTLTWRDPASFEAVKTVTVTLAGEAIDQLNELEWVDDRILANVWHSDEILRIDPTNGEVDAVIDASTLWNDPGRTSEMTLNGIAHGPGDPANTLWLTGKRWPQIHIVELVEVES